MKVEQIIGVLTILKGITSKMSERKVDQDWVLMLQVVITGETVADRMMICNLHHLKEEEVEAVEEEEVVVES